MMRGKDSKGDVDYERLGYTKGEAQSRFDKQAAFCAQGGTPPWKGDGQWRKDGKPVGDPAGPFQPKCGKR